MNRLLVAVGMLVVILGLLSLKYSSFSWVEETTATLSLPVVDVTLPAERVHTIVVPSTVSWGTAILGLLLVVVGLARSGNPPFPRAGERESR